MSKPRRSTKRGAARAKLIKRAQSFADWIAKEELTLEQVADKLGMSIQGVANLRNGQRAPSLTVAAKIAEVTGGKVPIEVWAT